MLYSKFTKKNVNVDLFIYESRDKDSKNWVAYIKLIRI